MARVLLAFDKQSARSFDADGRMRVKDCILSTAEVNPYRGQEIPGWKAMGLKPERAYDLYRHPEEMRKAASSFNGVPLMLKHIPQTADDPRKEYQAGSVYNVKFDGKHLRGDLLVSDGYAIDLIKSDELSDLSCSYRYDPDMTSGDNEGETFDGIMRNIQGNHVALVDDGRASDAHVADAAFNPQGSDPATAGATMPNPMSPHEERRTVQNEPAAPAAAAPAAAAPGAAAPGSPQGEMNEQSNTAAIGQALKHIAELLSDIHGKVGGAAPAAAAPAAGAPGDTAAVDAETEPDNAPPDTQEGIQAKDFSLEKATEGNEGTFSNEGANDEGEEQSGNYSTGYEGGQQGTTARGETTPTDIMDQNDKGNPSGAMDAKSVKTLVAKAVQNERTRAAGVAEALRETRGVLGEVYGMDDAGAIYREALAQIGVDVKHVAKGHEKTAWQAAKAAHGVKLGAGRRTGDTGSAAHAMDAKAVEANQSNVVQMLGKIRVLG